MTIEITRPEVEAMIRERLESGDFEDAQELIVQALRHVPKRRKRYSQAERAAAAEDLKTFGKRHGISLGGLTIRQLRDEGLV